MRTEHFKCGLILILLVSNGAIDGFHRHAGFCRWGHFVSYGDYNRSAGTTFLLRHELYFSEP